MLAVCCNVHMQDICKEDLDTLVVSVRSLSTSDHHSKSGRCRTRGPCEEGGCSYMKALGHNITEEAT